MLNTLLVEATTTKIAYYYYDTTLLGWLGLEEAYNKDKLSRINDIESTLRKDYFKSSYMSLLNK